MSNKHALALVVLIGLSLAVAFSDRLEVASKQTNVESTSVSSSIQDGEIISLVKARLFLAPETAAFAIDVTSNNGVVTLAGEVSSIDEKNVAQQLIEEIEGVKYVNNALVIAP